MKPVNTKLISCIFSLFIFLSVPSFAFAEEHGHEHGQHEEHEEPGLNFSAAQLQEFDIKLSQASSGVINKTRDLTGEVIVAPERLFHIVPRVSGVVRQVFKHLGDKVATGDLLATLSSRELANAKAEFVAAESLLQLANTNLKRERDLYKSNITAKRNYLAARQVQAEMSIKRKAAELDKFRLKCRLSVKRLNNDYWQLG